MRLFILVIALILTGTDDGSKKGRKGNESYRNQEHAEAAALYRQGLEETEASRPGRVLAGLWNNLGSSLFRLGNFEQARQAFSNAIGFATSSREVSDFAYNAGNTSYNAAQQPAAPQPGAPGAPAAGAAGEGMQEALEYYRQALLADPENEDAKFNYEFVKRQLQEQEQNQDQQDQQNEGQQQQNQDQQNEDQQQNQDQQNQDQQNQDQQEQNQQQQQNQDQSQRRQQEQQQQPDPTRLSREEAERILQALQNEEEELLRQVMKPQTRPKKVEKDW